MGLPQELRNEVATIQRDITIPAYAGVMRVTDDTLITRGGGRGLRIYDDIERDCHAFAVLQKRKLAVIGREWKVDPATSSSADQKAADLVTAQLSTLAGNLADDLILPQALGFDAVCLNLLDSLLKGFSVGEIMWATDGSEIVAAEVRARDQRRFEFATVPTGGFSLTLKTWENLVPGIPVPARKFIVQSFGAKDGSPHGMGLGSRLFWPVFFKRQGITFWLTFVDKFAAPTAVGTYPAGTDEPGKQKLLAALAAIASEAGVAVPEGMVITLLEAARSGSIDCYEKLARYMDEQISEAVLGETGSTNQSSGGGSRARDEVGNDIRLEIVKADADLQCAVLNATLVRWITLFNCPQGTNPPRVWRDCAEPEDLKSRADRDKIIFDMGFKPTLKYITDTYGGEWVPFNSAQGPGQILPVPPLAKGGDTKGGGISFAAGVTADGADRIAERLGAESLPLMDSLVEPLRKLVMSAGSLEEIRDGLLGLYGEMNPADLGVLMEQALTLGDLAGRSEVLDGD